MLTYTPIFSSVFQVISSQNWKLVASPKVFRLHQDQLKQIPQVSTGQTFQTWHLRRFNKNSSKEPQDHKISMFASKSMILSFYRADTSICFFPTCQVRVVRFYVSCLLVLLLLLLLLLLVLLLSSSSSSSSSCSTATRDPQCSLSDLNHDHPRPVFPAGPQPRPSTPSVPCRTSTTTIPRPVFPAGPQPRPSAPSVPCRTSTATIRAQCSLPDLNRDHPRPVVPAGPHVGRYGTKNVQKKVRKNVRKNVRRYARRYAR